MAFVRAFPARGETHGEMTEWPNVPDSKSGVPQGTGGSNPSLSAILCRCLRVEAFQHGDANGIGAQAAFRG